MTPSLRRKRASDDVLLSRRSGTRDGEAGISEGIHRVDALTASADLDPVGDSANTRRLVRALFSAFSTPGLNNREEIDYKAVHETTDTAESTSASIPIKAQSSAPQVESNDGDDRISVAEQMAEYLDSIGVEYMWARIGKDKHVYLDFNMRQVYASLNLMTSSRDWWRDGEDHASEA